MLVTRASVWVAVLVTWGSAQGWAQGAHSGAHSGAQSGAPALPATMPLSERARLRYPQPVRVGDLRDRQVLEPSQHQGVLGRVDGVWRRADGGLLLAFRYGGVLGWGTRVIAVPVEATALLGQFVQVVEIAEDRLGALPTWTGAGATALGADEVIRVGVNRN